MAAIEERKKETHLLAGDDSGRASSRRSEALSVRRCPLSGLRGAAAWWSVVAAHRGGKHHGGRKAGQWRPGRGKHRGGGRYGCV
jgi:hypothetical protein